MRFRLPELVEVLLRRAGHLFGEIGVILAVAKGGAPLVKGGVSGFVAEGVPQLCAVHGAVAVFVQEVVEAASEQEPLRVLDLACGNLRFERYLADALPNRMLSGYAVDNCDPLVEAGERNESDALSRMSFQNLDAIERLSAGCLREALEAPDASCGLAVSFGFMHHVPLERWRVELLRALVAKVRPGGFVAVSFWRFLNSDKLARKAKETTSRARAELGIPELPLNDYLLGWQDTQGLYRYCHHFDEPEIERLLAVVADSADLVSRFEADGKTGNLNEYVVLRVK